MSGKPGLLDNILNCPDEVLMNIISNLNARERVAFSKTSDRLNTLIFNDQKLFRQRFVDFSEEGYLTLASDVKQYFEDETKLKYIYRMNISGVYCTRPEEVLQSIRKATNLVEVNISGFKMKDLKEFGLFLEPQTYLLQTYHSPEYRRSHFWRQRPDPLENDIMQYDRSDSTK